MKPMILGKSTDNFQLQRIYLSLWSLQEEVELTLEHYKKEAPEKVQLVKDYYEGKIAVLPENNSSENDQADDAQVIDIKSKQEIDSKQIKGLRSSIDRKTPHQISKGHTFLFDINMHEVLIFSEKPYIMGQSVVVQFDIDQSFNMMAEVVYVKDIGSKSRIISPNKALYRIVCKFSFSIPGDRTILRNFISKLGPKPQAEEEKTQVPVKENKKIDDLDVLDIADK